MPAAMDDLLQRYAAMNVPIFAELSQESLMEAASLAKFKHFNKGDIVYRQGDPPSAFYVVLDGEVTMTSVPDAKDLEEKFSRIINEHPPEDDTPWELALQALVTGRNRAVHRYGYSSAQSLFGRQPRLPGDVLDRDADAAAVLDDDDDDPPAGGRLVVMRDRFAGGFGTQFPVASFRTSWSIFPLSVPSHLRRNKNSTVPLSYHGVVDQA